MWTTKTLSVIHTDNIFLQMHGYLKERRKVRKIWRAWRRRGRCCWLGPDTALKIIPFWKRKLPLEDFNPFAFGQSNNIAKCHLVFFNPIIWREKKFFQFRCKVFRSINIHPIMNWINFMDVQFPENLHFITWQNFSRFVSRLRSVVMSLIVIVV